MICTHTKEKMKYVTLELEDVVNDANVLQFYFYNPIDPEINCDEKRIEKLIFEFGLTLQ